MPIFGDTNLSDERAMSLAFDSLDDMPLLDKVIKERGLEEELKQAELEMAVTEAMWKAVKEGYTMAGFKEWAVYQRYNSKLFKLWKDLVYITEKGEEIITKKGFLSNLGSVPRIAWPLAPRDEFPSSYFTHDNLYTTKAKTRKEADYILYESLLYSNCPKWKAKLIYKAVRLFGGGHYS